MQELIFFGFLVCLADVVASEPWFHDQRSSPNKVLKNQHCETLLATYINDCAAPLSKPVPEPPKLMDYVSIQTHFGREMEMESLMEQLNRLFYRIVVLKKEDLRVQDKAHSPVGVKKAQKVKLKQQDLLKPTSREDKGLQSCFCSSSEATDDQNHCEECLFRTFYTLLQSRKDLQSSQDIESLIHAIFSQFDRNCGKKCESLEYDISEEEEEELGPFRSRRKVKRGFEVEDFTEAVRSFLNQKSSE